MTGVAQVLPGLFPPLREDVPPPPAQVRDRVVASAEQAANAARAQFSLDAEACIVHQLRVFGPRSGEQLVDGCKAADIRPRDDRAFGGVIQRLQRHGVMHIVGTKAREKGHLSPGCRIWALVEGTSW